MGCHAGKPPPRRTGGANYLNGDAVRLRVALDRKYLDILDLLKKDGKLTSNQISRRLKIPSSTVHNRIKKLESDGIITGYTVHVDYQKLGKSLLAHILIKTAYKTPAGKQVSQEQLAARIKALGADEVSTVLVDEADILVSVRTHDLYEIKEFTKKLQQLDGIARTHTLIVLNTI